MQRALITGITGQDGRFLAQFLTGKGYQVFGVIRGQNNPKADMVVDETPSLELVDDQAFRIRVGLADDRHAEVLGLHGDLSVCGRLDHFTPGPAHHGSNGQPGGRVRFNICAVGAEC